MRLSKSQTIVLAGDALVLALITLYGLNIHQMLSSAPTMIWRTFLPWLVTWVLMGFYVNAFDLHDISLPNALLRPLWGLILAAPLAGFLRAAWLGTDVVVIFVVIFGGLSALAVSAWRGVYWLLARRGTAHG